MTTYRERLRVPVWWAVIGLGVALLLAAEVHSGARGWRAVVPYVVALPLVVLGLVWLSRQEVRVQDGVLHVAGARAPLTAFGPAEVLDRDALRLWLGPAAQRDAWVAVRPWLTSAVRLPVTDPDDETPYWLVGTRDPVGLAVALSPVPQSPAP
ncbi:MAG: DUF3093 domain-containing protein [Mycobacteriales bacterium]